MPFWNGLFTKHVFKVYPCCRVSGHHFISQQSNIPLYRYDTFCFSIHEMFFHFFSIMNSAAINICVQVVKWTYVFSVLGCILRIAGSYANSMMNLLRDS